MSIFPPDCLPIVTQIIISWNMNQNVLFFSISFHHKFRVHRTSWLSVTIQVFYSNSKNAILLSLIKLLLTFFNSEDSAFFVKERAFKNNYDDFKWFFPDALSSSWDPHYYIPIPHQFLQCFCTLFFDFQSL